MICITARPISLTSHLLWHAYVVPFNINSLTFRPVSDFQPRWQPTPRPVHIKDPKPRESVLPLTLCSQPHNSLHLPKQNSTHNPIHSCPPHIGVATHRQPCPISLRPRRRPPLPSLPPPSPLPSPPLPSSQDEKRGRSSEQVRRRPRSSTVA